MKYSVQQIYKKSSAPTAFFKELPKEITPISYPEPWSYYARERLSFNVLKVAEQLVPGSLVKIAKPTGAGFTYSVLHNEPDAGELRVLIVPVNSILYSKQKECERLGSDWVEFINGEYSIGRFYDFGSHSKRAKVLITTTNQAAKPEFIELVNGWSGRVSIFYDEFDRIQQEVNYRPEHAKVLDLPQHLPQVKHIAFTGTPNRGEDYDYEVVFPNQLTEEIPLSELPIEYLEHLPETIEALTEMGAPVIILTNISWIFPKYWPNGLEVREAPYMGSTLTEKLAPRYRFPINPESKVIVISKAGAQGLDIHLEEAPYIFAIGSNDNPAHELTPQIIAQAAGRSRKVKPCHIALLNDNSKTPAIPSRQEVQFIIDQARRGKFDIKRLNQPGKVKAKFERSRRINTPSDNVLEYFRKICQAIIVRYDNEQYNAEVCEHTIKSYQAHALNLQGYTDEEWLRHGIYRTNTPIITAPMKKGRMPKPTGASVKRAIESNLYEEGLSARMKRRYYPLPFGSVQVDADLKNLSKAAAVISRHLLLTKAIFDGFGESYPESLKGYPERMRDLPSKVHGWLLEDWRRKQKTRRPDGYNHLPEFIASSEDGMSEANRAEHLMELAYSLACGSLKAMPSGITTGARHYNQLTGLSTHLIKRISEHFGWRVFEVDAIELHPFQASVLYGFDIPYFYREDENRERDKTSVNMHLNTPSAERRVRKNTYVKNATDHTPSTIPREFWIRHYEECNEQPKGWHYNRMEQIEAANMRRLEEELKTGIKKNPLAGITMTMRRHDSVLVFARQDLLNTIGLIADGFDLVIEGRSFPNRMRVREIT